MRRKPAYKIIAIVAAGVLLVWLNMQGWLTPVKNLTGRVLEPVGSWLGGAGRAAGESFFVLTHVSGLAAENARLERQVAELRTRLSRNTELLEQTEALRRQFDLKEDDDRQLVAARVVSYQPDNFRQFLTINRGSRAGVQVGQAVISEDILVGRVSEVSDSSAKIFLITDPNFKINALIQDTRAGGTVRGQIGAGLVMDKIAQTDTVEPGQTVITSGLGGEAPRGIIIGYVESVAERDNAVFQTAQIVSGLRLNQLEVVFVVKQ